MTQAAQPRMTADKSHLLAYLKHTPGFERQVKSFLDLSIMEILDRVREQDEAAYRKCVARFEQHGVRLLETAAD